jgi:hypothetical protein
LVNGPDPFARVLFFAGGAKQPAHGGGQGGVGVGVAHGIPAPLGFGFLKRKGPQAHVAVGSAGVLENRSRKALIRLSFSQIPHLENEAGIIIPMYPKTAFQPD